METCLQNAISWPNRGHAFIRNQENVNRNRNCSTKWQTKTSKNLKDENIRQIRQKTNSLTRKRKQKMKMLIYCIFLNDLFQIVVRCWILISKSFLSFFLNCKSRIMRIYLNSRASLLIKSLQLTSNLIWFGSKDDIRQELLSSGLVHVIVETNGVRRKNELRS